MRGKAGLFSRFQQFSPATIAGLSGWWDASDSATLFDATTGGSAVAADGGVARWEDKSGNARHWKQNNTANRPLRKTSVKNSLDVLRFDGSLSVMQMTGFDMNFISPSAHTVFAVAVATSIATDGGNPFENAGIIQDDPAYSATGLFTFRSSGSVGSYGFNGGHVGATQAYAEGEWKAFASLRSAMLSVYVNGTPGTAVSFSGDYEFFSDNTPQLGSGYGGAFNGDLAELIAFNVALSASDREAVESYLMDKWAIT